MTKTSDVIDQRILQALLKGDISFIELMNAYDIRLSIAFDLESTVLGFVYVSRKNNYHVILNGNINFETQCHVFLHELKHIELHLPKMGYIIGMDMQRELFEAEAG